MRLLRPLVLLVVLLVGLALSAITASADDGGASPPPDGPGAPLTPDDPGFGT